MDLPSEFNQQMQFYLGSEWPALALALADKPWRGIRLHRWNTQSPTSKEFFPLNATFLPVPEAYQPLFTAPVPWSTDGYYVPTESKIGKTIYHEAGAFYLQEPSAMAAVTALNPQPGERILDLCAAPGGKTTAISKQMQGQGELVANEIHPKRVLTLAENLERTGVTAVVTNETPANLAACWPESFDAVLVDAPCSGEGMFRKDPRAIQEWHSGLLQTNSHRQREILHEAIKMVRPGGRVVYCTCTLNPVENEQVVAWGITHLPISLEVLPVWPGWHSGRPEWAGDVPELAHTRRLWPHTGRGEGHFVALLRKQGSATPSLSQDVPLNKRKAPKHLYHSPAIPKGWQEALLDWLVENPPENWLHPIIQGNLWFALATRLPLTGLRVLRPGLALATYEHGRFYPHHSLARAIPPGLARRPVDISPAAAAAYMSGEPLSASQPVGWQWLHVHGLPVGWGKSSESRVNNAYPKGLRKHGLLW
ncbi:RNA methyltransferase [Alicyclobacillaceae bacterium I2511]|nr:RNA methyltransferase [Alicyclobacillaceae bacterium I2511]